MHSVYHRERNGGGTFVTTLPDGTDVAWRPLTIGEFVEYDNLIKSKKYPLAYIEDEVFRKCVLDKYLITKLDNLNAGIVSAVASNILSFSGPASINELTDHLEINRLFASEIMHTLVSYVCQAFPAYKLEDVYAMNYMTFMLRVAQSEAKLLRTGAVAEPLKFIPPDQEENSEAPVEPKPPPRKDLAERFKEQNLTKPLSVKQTVITTDEINEHVLAYTGHEKSDKDVLEHQMIKDTTAIYKDYLQQAKDGKITMKTPEQRKAEYLASIEAIKEKEAKLKEKKEVPPPEPPKEKKPKRILRKGRR